MEISWTRRFWEAQVVDMAGDFRMSAEIVFSKVGWKYWHIIWNPCLCAAILMCQWDIFLGHYSLCVCARWRFSHVFVLFFHLCLSQIGLSWFVLEWFCFTCLCVCVFFCSHLFLSHSDTLYALTFSLRLGTTVMTLWHSYGRLKRSWLIFSASKK